MENFFILQYMIDIVALSILGIAIVVVLVGYGWILITSKKCKECNMRYLEKRQGKYWCPFCREYFDKK